MQLPLQRLLPGKVLFHRRFDPGNLLVFINQMPVLLKRVVRPAPAENQTQSLLLVRPLCFTDCVRP